MNDFCRKLKMLGYALLIILMALGAGICGGIPLPTTRRKENDTNDIELLVDLNDTKSKLPTASYEKT